MSVTWSSKCLSNQLQFDKYSEFQDKLEAFQRNHDAFISTESQTMIKRDKNNSICTGILAN